VQHVGMMKGTGGVERITNTVRGSLWGTKEALTLGGGCRRKMAEKESHIGLEKVRGVKADRPGGEKILFTARAWICEGVIVLVSCYSRPGGKQARNEIERADS